MTSRRPANVQYYRLQLGAVVRRAIGVVIVGVALSLGVAHGEVVSTTVCQLTKEPTKFDGKIVRFTAIYETDHTHFSFFIDKGCVLDEGLDDEGEESVRLFKAAIFAASIHRHRSRFYVDLTGCSESRRIGSRQPSCQLLLNLALMDSWIFGR